MIIHFAFGALGKAGRVEEQCERFIKDILGKKRLKFSVCEEFVPIPERNKDVGITLDLRAGDLKDGKFSVSTKNLVEAPEILYLPFDVSMICFIEISYTKLANCVHSKEYGKLGIAFTRDFYKKSGCRQVYYYSEKMIFYDKLIKQFQEGQGVIGPKKLKELQTEITTYRKPNRLYDNFSKSTVASIKNGSELNFYTYNRYPTNYNFENENEYRIAASGNQEFLEFSESDVYRIFVPTPDVEKHVSKYIENNWSSTPTISIYHEGRI